MPHIYVHGETNVTLRNAYLGMGLTYVQLCRGHKKNKNTHSKSLGLGDKIIRASRSVNELWDIMIDYMNE